MKLNKIRMFLVAALIVGVAFFMVKEKVHAEVIGKDTNVDIEESVRFEDRGGAISVRIPNKVQRVIPAKKGVTVLADSSGVAELDQAAERTNKLINWVCGWLGGIMALFGFIWAAMNQAGHNTESRNMGIVVGIIGVVIAFAPSIVKWILGK